MIPSLYLRIAAYGLAALLFGSIGWFVNGDRWQAKYETLQASHAQDIADAQEAGRKALQAQLEQFQATSANNAKVIYDLQTQTQQAQADSARDRDLVQRLLNAASRDPGYHAVSKTGDQSGATPASQAPGDGQIGELLVATADECRANARQLNALIAEIQPQL